MATHGNGLIALGRGRTVENTNLKYQLNCCRSTESIKLSTHNYLKGGLKMWIYEKGLEYPIKIKTCNPKMAKYIITQYGGPDGELGASIRYLSQRFTMPTDEAKATLNDIGTEELAHLEMVGSMVHQLLKGVPAKELEKAGLGSWYTEHDHAVYPMDASGVPFSAAALQSKGDVIADLAEDMAAEQKARATYENLIRLADDPDVIDPLRFLREREVVHFQRFGEVLDLVQRKYAEKKYYMNT
jgi:spore coat protein JC